MSQRWAWAEVDLAAIRHNVVELARLAAPAELWVVVKADGYGHGAAAVATAALHAGAAGLAVALVQEGVALRSAGITAPILVLSQQPPEQARAMAAADLIPTVFTIDAAETLAAVAPAGYPIHVKVDTGMQRIGVAPEATEGLLTELADRTPSLVVAGLFTHLAVADEPAHPATEQQLQRFDAVLEQLDRVGLRPPIVHVANSAGILAWPSAHRTLVRAGVAVYGISPSPALDHLATALRPALALKARVSHVKRVAAGSHVSYGWRHEFASATQVATVPIGYADGVSRRLGSGSNRAGADVLIGGRRCPIVGVVTMDQLMVDVGEAPVAVGDEVVLIGEQGEHRITAADWAARLDTIAYEIVCAISSRIERVVLDA